MDPDRFLVLGYQHLGDSLFLTPMLRALDRRFPRAHIAVMARGAGAAALENNPHVDHIWRLSGRGMRPKLALLPLLRRERFDAAIVAQHTLPNALFAWLAGCSIRVGIPTKGCGPVLTHRVHEPDPPAVWHEADRYLAFAAALGADRDAAGLEYHPAAADRLEAAALLARLGLRGRRSEPMAGRPPLVALFPGSSPQWKFKRWPAARFAQIGRELVEDRGAQLIVVGGRDDLPAMHEVSAAITGPHGIDDNPGALGRFAALLGECDLLITNDSGPMHLATAVGTRVVDLAGPSDPRRTGPYGPDHIVVQKVPPDGPKRWAEEPDPELPMKLISVEDVRTAVATALATPFPPGYQAVAAARQPAGEGDRGR